MLCSLGGDHFLGGLDGNLQSLDNGFEFDVSLNRIDLAFVDAVNQALGDLGDFCLADVSLGDGD